MRFLFQYLGTWPYGAESYTIIGADEDEQTER